MLRVDAQSKLVAVTVYQNQAQVFRSASVKLLKGEHQIVFADGMWTEADRSTLQVNLRKGAEVTLLRSVQFKTITERKDIRKEKAEVQEELTKLNQDMQVIDDAISIIRVRLESYQAVLNKVMKSQRVIAGATYDPAAWTKVLAFAQMGIVQWTTQLRTREDEKTALQTKINEARQKVQRFGGDTLVTTKDVAEVNLHVLADVELEMLLSYMVRNASWVPVYDLRVDSKVKKMNVSYNAMVKQFTGEAWEKVSLELSTANPHIGGTPPTLQPWRISFNPPYQLQQKQQDVGSPAPRMMMQQMMCANMMPNAMEVQMMPAMAPAPPPRPVAVQAAEVASSSTATVFKIAGQQSVKSDNEPVKVGVVTVDFNGFFRYSVVPKLDSHTYLKVKAINSSECVFLPGKCNIFADSQFVSNSTMDLVAPGEEFWTFVGVDDGIRVKRTLVHRKSAEKGGGMFSGKRSRIEYSYNFTVKNTKKTVEEVVVWDQYPISDDKKITVQITQPEEGKSPIVFKTNDLHAIEWFVKPKPNEEVTFPFVFYVEYPADENITGA